MKLQLFLVLALAVLAYAEYDDDYYPSEDSSSDSYGSSDDDGPSHAGSDNYGGGQGDDSYGSSEDSYDGDGDSSGPSSDYDDRRKRSISYTESQVVPNTVVRVRRAAPAPAAPPPGIGPVHTHVKTDYHGNFQWGVRHRAGGGR